MKVWFGYSSEHSSRMRIIGHFKTAENVKSFLAEFTRMQELVAANNEACFANPEEFPLPILDGLFHGDIKHGQSLAAHDLLDFTNEMTVSAKDKDFVIRSSEWNWAGIIKMLIESGAKVEMFSEHDYPVVEDEGKSR